MRTKTLAILIISLILISCGKKEEPQTQTTPQNQQQMQQPQQQTQQQQTQQQQTQQQQTQQQQSVAGETPVSPEQKKLDEEKKKAEEKKQADEKKKLVDTTRDDLASDINFAPIFQQKCVKCHGKDGKGKAEGTPDFTSASFKKKSDDRLFKSISNGIKADNPDNEDMPAWKGKLTDAQIRAAIKYVKGL